VKVLKSLTKEVELYLASNNITTIDNLERLKNLEILDISNNPIISFDVLKKLPISMRNPLKK